jgi:RNA polymerase sigma-70 factor (ECF subfamily)
LGLSETALVQQLLEERARLLAYVWAIVRDSHIAEDVFQEVSLLAVRKRSEIRDLAAFPTWLRKSARLCALRALRGVGKSPLLFSNEVLDNLDRAWDEQPSASTAEMAAALQHCLGRLAPRARRIVALRYQHKLGGDEVASRLDMKTHSVYVALGRIHRALRDCMLRALREKGVSRG